MYTVPVVTRNRASRSIRLGLAAMALASASTAHAYLTVGPHGSYASIQDAVNAAIAAGGDEVRVENCVALCMWLQRVDFETTASVQLSGGWASDFQSQIPDYTTHLIGTGEDAPTIRAIARGSAIISVNRFALDGTGNSGSGSSGFYTRGLVGAAYESAVLVVDDNLIYGNVVYTSTTASPAGGAGVALQATDNALVSMAGNRIEANQLLGTDGEASYGGGAYVTAIGNGHVDFVLNTLVDNIASNPNGGACRGGGAWASAADGSSLQLRGNDYTGNAQLFCTNGATGDAAEIAASGTAVVDVYDETWTNNRVDSDPGVYQVFMQADVSSLILAQNGLITHGTWGGLFANSLASASIYISNYTIADNPVLGIRGIGAGTQLWNSLLWNNGSDSPDLENGATLAYCLAGTDPSFADPANGNYTLLPGSAAIDAGTNDPAGGLRGFDLAGNPRPYNGVADIGAYEFQGVPNDRIFADGFDG